MRHLKLAIITFSLIAGLLSYGLMAADYDKIGRELDVLSDFMKRTVKENDDCEKCSVKIRTHYLANQGAVFQVRRAGSYGFVSVNSDGNHQEFVLPSLPLAPEAPLVHGVHDMDEVILSVDEAMISVDEALKDINMDISVDIDSSEDSENDNSFWSWNWTDDNHDQNREYRDIARERRAAKRELHQIERQIARASEDDLKSLEEEREKAQKAYEEARERYEEVAKDRKEKIRKRIVIRNEKLKERKAEFQKKNNKTMELVLATLCDYQATLKSLPDDEHVSIIFEGMEDRVKSNFMIFKKSKLESCEPEASEMEEISLKYVM